MIKTNSGWIRIVEAFTMILLITGIFLMVFNRDSPEDFSQKIYEKEQEILRRIQLNDSLRESILSFDIETLPIKWENFPHDLKEEIISKTPSNLECKAKICNVKDICVLSETSKESIYAQSVTITATLEKYSPRKLKLFCWEISSVFGDSGFRVYGEGIYGEGIFG